MELIPGCTWIYGDSFGVHWPQGWTGMLASQLSMARFNNRCQGGSSAQDAHYRLMQDLATDRICYDDRIIFVVSQKHRWYRNQEVTRSRHDRKRWGNLELLANNSLMNRASLRDSCYEARRRDLPLLVIWAFPSTWPGDINLLCPQDRPTNYGGMLGLQTWDWAFSLISPDSYEYDDVGLLDADEIRPALLWYSLRGQTEKQHKLMEGSNDMRPNHIEDLNVHRCLSEYVAQWIKGQWKGTRDLRDCTEQDK